ncbi:MAG: sugar phosphate isomerase/epimerase family protein [Gemmobacter sp.]
MTLSLHHLSLRDVAPADLPAIAAGAGFGAVSLFVEPPGPALDIFPRIACDGDAAAAARACADAGVAVHGIEVFALAPETEPVAFAPALDRGARLGARVLTALVQDADGARAADRMGALCDMAAARGMGVALEFMRFSQCRSLAAGAAFVAQVGHPALGLLVDPLHLFRTGGTVVELAAMPPALVRAAQLCDGPLLPPPGPPFAEAIENRVIPGEGEFPLAAFLRALPPGTRLDVEVPLRRLADAGVTPADRAARLFAAATAIIAAAATPDG